MIMGSWFRLIRRTIPSRPMKFRFRDSAKESKSCRWPTRCTIRATAYCRRTGVTLRTRMRKTRCWWRPLHRSTARPATKYQTVTRQETRCAEPSIQCRIRCRQRREVEDGNTAYLMRLDPIPSPSWNVQKHHKPKRTWTSQYLRRSSTISRLPKSLMSNLC